MQEKKALAAAGVTSIVGEYSGFGDEGNFNGVFAVGHNGSPAKYEVPEKIEGLIEQVADIMATPGYQNNGGGGGTITLDVETCSIVHQSYNLVVERYEYPEVCF